MSKIENGKPKIYFGNIKMSILAYETLFKEEFAKVDARISKIERKLVTNGGPKPESKK